MIEVIGDVFTYGPPDKKIARVIPTNGDTNGVGKAVMGRGVALQAASRYKSLPVDLGALILSRGNHVHEVALEDGMTFVAFPTKHTWREAADMNLIERSARELVNISDNYDLVILPRVGAGNGQLSWKNIRDLLLGILVDDKFIVASLTDPTDPYDFVSKKWKL